MLSSLRVACFLRTTPYVHQTPSSVRLLSSAAPQVNTKSELGKLRKKTGYSLSVCKKALNDCDNDLARAELWLKEQAQAQGWAKATKLQGRNTSQGLMGVKIRGSMAAMVELNCETDFVARNEKFLSLIDQISNECVNIDVAEGKTVLEQEAVAALPGGEGKTLADLVALNIGHIGENLALGKVTLFKAGDGVKLSGLSHPSVESQEMDKLQTGRYSALLSYTVNKEDPIYEGQTAASLTRGLCQHIIGLAPTAISDEEDKDNSLVHQSYLLDEDVKVGNLLEKAGIQVVDFVRAEVGRE